MLASRGHPRSAGGWDPVERDHSLCKTIQLLAWAWGASQWSLRWSWESRWRRAWSHRQPGPWQTGPWSAVRPFDRERGSIVRFWATRQTAPKCATHKSSTRPASLWTPATAQHPGSSSYSRCAESQCISACQRCLHGWSHSCALSSRLTAVWDPALALSTEDWGPLVATFSPKCRTGSLYCCSTLDVSAEVRCASLSGAWAGVGCSEGQHRSLLWCGFSAMRWCQGRGLRCRTGG